MAPRRIEVRAGGAAYEAIVGEHLLEQLGLLIEGAGLAPGTRAFLAHDAGLPSHLIERASHGLAQRGFRVSTAPVASQETSKSLAGAQTLLVEIARTRHERHEPVIALGGGIVGDVAGFAAAVYRRGVPVIQCPTTLLGMVDAAVGGKTAVNLEVGGDLLKNLVGAFHQPRLVVADITALQSLAPRQLRSGFAECIKHGMIGAEFGEGTLLDWLEAHSASLLRSESPAVCELVARNVALKAAVIENDEREERDDAGRALLNLGHTFGHAIETVESAQVENAGEPGVLHGEAVALGLIAAARCAEAAGYIPSRLGLSERILHIVERFGLPTRASGMPASDVLLGRMAHDKKVRAGALRLVLPTGIGRAALFADPPRHAILAGFEAILARS